jgi:hypothetical protein
VIDTDCVTVNDVQCRVVVDKECDDFQEAVTVQECADAFETVCTDAVVEECSGTNFIKLFTAVSYEFV